MPRLDDDVCALIAATAACRPRTLIAVDGPDAAGKTTFADDLAQRLPVVRAGVDHFHRPRAVRTRRGRHSAEGYYRDGFDVDALVRDLLRPFRSGEGRVRTRAFDHRADAPLVREADVPPAAVLVVDGVFLLRPELRSWWDLALYLHVPEHVTLARGLARDVPGLGTAQDVRELYRQRYLPGQALYRAEADPVARADVVLDTSDPVSPSVVRWRA